MHFGMGELPNRQSILMPTEWEHGFWLIDCKETSVSDHFANNACIHEGENKLLKDTSLSFIIQGWCKTHVFKFLPFLNMQYHICACSIASSEHIWKWRKLWLWMICDGKWRKIRSDRRQLNISSGTMPGRFRQQRRWFPWIFANNRSDTNVSKNKCKSKSKYERDDSEWLVEWGK